MPRLKIVSFILLFAFISVSISGPVVIRAQDANTCENLLIEAIQSVQDICSDLQPGNACTPSGDTISLGEMETLETAALNLEANQWDSALIKIATSGQPIAMALFGGAQVTYSALETALPTQEPLIASNKSGYNVNLRSGPGKDFELAGFFGWDKTATVDGRNADNDWLRLQTDEGMAWIASDLVSLQGDINNLPVLSGDANPSQQFTLRTPDATADCGAGASGLLVSRSGNDSVGLQVNGTNLTFDTVTLLLQAKPNANLEIFVIEGETAVDAGGEQITAQEGETAEVGLGGTTGLQADAAPLVKPSYPFTSMIGVPLELVSDETLACTAGLSDDIATVSLFEQPDSEATVAGLLLFDAHYNVSGWLADDEGNQWWQLNDGWVRQDTVQVTGACETVDEISATNTVVSGMPIRDKTFYRERA
jgi:SH3-like domain-containing protein